MPTAMTMSAGKLQMELLRLTRRYASTHCWAMMPENTPVSTPPAISKTRLCEIPPPMSSAVEPESPNGTATLVAFAVRNDRRSIGAKAMTSTVAAITTALAM